MYMHIMRKGILDMRTFGRVIVWDNASPKSKSSIESFISSKSLWVFSNLGGSGKCSGGRNRDSSVLEPLLGNGSELLDMGSGLLDMGSGLLERGSGLLDGGSGLLDGHSVGRSFSSVEICVW